jgi:hypothetical protein
VVDVRVTGGGEPTDEEVAAIVAAVEAVWPRPVLAAGPASEPDRWRFSGRWWAKPVPVRRDRPAHYR